MISDRELQQLQSIRGELADRVDVAMGKLAAMHLRAVAACQYELAADCAQALNTLWESREANPDLFNREEDDE